MVFYINNLFIILFRFHYLFKLTVILDKVINIEIFNKLIIEDKKIIAR